MNLYDDSANGIYDQSDIKRMAWAGALADIGAMSMGQAPQGRAISMPMQARQAREEQIRYQQGLKRQAEQDEINKRLVDSRISKNNYDMQNSGGMQPIGSPQRLDNGNIGVTVSDPSTEKGFRVVDTGSAYRGDPDLGEKLQYEKDLYDIKEKGKYQDTMIGAEKSYVSAETALSGLNRAKSLLDSGVETGTMKAIFAPEFWLSPDHQELVSLVNEAVLSASEQMSGVLSESDMKFLKGSTISKDKSPEANQKILERKIGLLEKAKLESKRKYSHFKAGGNYFDWSPVWEQMESAPSVNAPVKITDMSDEDLFQ